jgi:membrane-bound lytic murein transglycosylase C
MKRGNIPVYLLLGASSLMAGCETLNKVLDTSEQAIAITRSPTAQGLTSVARAGDKKEAVKTALKGRGADYKADPQQLINDVRQIQRDYKNLVNFLSGNVGRTWGQAEMRLPTRTHYVKYTQNYMSRAVVDFDAGTIVVETVDEKDPKSSLRNAIVTTLLTPSDPRSVDLFSDRQIELTSAQHPYLYGLVADHRGKPVGEPSEAEAFAEHLLGSAGTREIESGEGKKDALYVKFAMVPQFENKQAERFRPMVAKYAGKHGVSESLVLAVIRTESNFNPFAVSHAPAYGLMQLVPTSGGREAYQHVTGENGVPSRDYLFDAEQNIQLGTAYLGLLATNHLSKVGSPISREYCVISAYNTGPGNVLRTFSKNRDEAVNQINRLEPPAVYEKLRTSLPYEETRHYLQKVTNYRRQFVTRAEGNTQTPR